MYGFVLLDVATPVRLILADPDLEEDFVAERGGPGGLPDDNRLLAARACLGRTVGDAVVGILTIPARALLVPEQVQLVARVELRGQSEVGVLPRAIAEGLPAVIGIVEPRIRVAGVLVVVHVRDVLCIPLASEARKEPEAVLAQGTAHRCAVVVVLDQRRGGRQPGVLQLLRVVAALEPTADRRPAKKLPDTLLPPVRGTMLSTGPPVSVSPMLPDTVNDSSCELRVSAT